MFFFVYASWVGNLLVSHSCNSEGARRRKHLKHRKAFTNDIPPNVGMTSDKEAFGANITAIKHILLSLNFIVCRILHIFFNFAADYAKSFHHNCIAVLRHIVSDGSGRCGRVAATTATLVQTEVAAIQIREAYHRTRRHDVVLPAARTACLSSTGLQECKAAERIQQTHL